MTKRGERNEGDVGDPIDRKIKAYSDYPERSIAIVPTGTDLEIIEGEPVVDDKKYIEKARDENQVSMEGPTRPESKALNPNEKMALMFSYMETNGDWNDMQKKSAMSDKGLNKDDLYVMIAEFALCCKRRDVMKYSEGSAIDKIIGIISAHLILDNLEKSIDLQIIQIAKESGVTQDDCFVALHQIEPKIRWTREKLAIYVKEAIEAIRNMLLNYKQRYDVPEK